VRGEGACRLLLRDGSEDRLRVERPLGDEPVAATRTGSTTSFRQRERALDSIASAGKHTSSEGGERVAGVRFSGLMCG
jgi:hypothetical protein